MNQDLVALKTMLYHDYVSYPAIRMLQAILYDVR